MRAIQATVATAATAAIAFVSACSVGQAIEDDDDGGSETALVPADQRAPRNTDPSFVVVWNLNLHQGCDAEGQILEQMADKAQSSYRPDIILLQNAGDFRPEGCTSGPRDNAWKAFAAKVVSERFTNEVYESIAGNDDGRNVILYRRARFAQDGVALRWTALTYDLAAATCVPEGGGELQLAAKLRDRESGKSFVAASLHLPHTDDEAGAPDGACMDRNLDLVDRKIHEAWPSPDAIVIAGDFNEGKASSNCWYDGMYALSGGEPANAKTCFGPNLGYYDAVMVNHAATIDEHWTIGGKGRIDFVFVRWDQNGVSRPFTETEARARLTSVMTAPFECGSPLDGGCDGTTRYSDHRAQRVHVHY